MTAHVTSPADLPSRSGMCRRRFLASSAAALSSGLRRSAVEGRDRTFADLAGEVGITTSSLSRHLVGRPQSAAQFTLLELPRILRDELDMRVIDLNTSSLGQTDRSWLDRVRTAATDAGCVLTNLKMNQSGLDMNSRDTAVRDRALAVYQQSIDAASHLGIPFVRPLPLKQRPDMSIHVDSYRRLVDYGAERNVRLLVENYGWMESDPESIPKLMRAIDRNVAATPDTGNWASDEIRYAGLRAAFPLAVSCDFKARALAADGHHAAWDLQRCFDIGWQSGFRGPWCLEHAHRDRSTLFRELRLLRDQLRDWMHAATA